LTDRIRMTRQSLRALRVALLIILSGCAGRASTTSISSTETTMPTTGPSRVATGGPATTPLAAVTTRADEKVSTASVAGGGKLFPAATPETVTRVTREI